VDEERRPPLESWRRTRLPRPKAAPDPAASGGLL